jgi:hypothetical protein
MKYMELTKSKEVYFVGSNSDFPEKIFFSKEDVFASDYTYIDAFDVNGKLVFSYKYDEESKSYTTDF